MQRKSGRIRCSNCSKPGSLWRLRFVTDARGTATLHAYCIECRCRLEIKVRSSQMKRLEREGALIYD